ncbi:MAG: DotA/TraY family protein [Gammaproteobacteria bacterium]
MKRLALLCLLFCMPQVSWGVSTALLMPPGTDKSLEYLGLIFGAVGGLPLGPGSPIFSQMSLILNQVILIMAFIVVAYTTLVSAINTAQEGEVMGKKWSIIWVPVRIAGGLFMLMPTATGYSYIQVFVMWFIVNGIGLADQIWDQVIAGTIESGTSLYTAESTHSTSSNSAEAVSGILQSKMCSDFLNTGDHGLDLKEDITLFRDGDIIGWGYADAKDPICGYIIIPKFTSFLNETYSETLDIDVEAEEEAKKELYFSEIAAIDTMLDGSAQEALELDKEDWTLTGNIEDGAALLDNAIIAMTTTTPDVVDFSAIGQGAHMDGWIHAGSYYFKLVAGSAYTLTPPNVKTNYMEMNLFDEFGDVGNTHESTIESKANNYIQAAHDELYGPIGPERDTITEGYDDSSSTGLQNEAATAFNSIFGTFFTDIALAIVDSIHSSTDDPIVSMGIAGSNIVIICETIIFAAAIGVFLLQLVTGIMACCNPLASSVNFVVYTVIPVALGVLLMCWAGGLTLAIYVPLIPFLVFTFSAFAWFLLVIEAMVAAPLIALGFVIPSEDEIGRASHGVMLIMHIFLRPSLMIVGFVLGAKLLYIGMGMLHFGFEYVLLTQITGIGIFGAVAIVILYCGMALTIVHECFSMIFIVPDKVLTWMGGHAEHSKVMENVKQAKGYQDKAAGSSSSLMKGAVAGAGSAGKAIGGTIGQVGQAAAMLA